MKKIFLIFILFCATIVSINFFKVGQTITYWKGAIRTSNKQNEVIIRLEKSMFGATTGYISSPEQFVMNHKISNCKFTGDSLNFQMNDNSPQSIFKGKIKGNQINGEWSQGDRHSFVSLFKTEKKSVLQAEADAMVSYAKAFSIYKKMVNWDSLANLKYFAIDQIEEDSALIITGQKLLSLLNDNHGGIIYKGDYLKNPNAPRRKNIGKTKFSTYFFLFKMSPQMLEKDIAYIRIPTLAGQSNEEMDQIVLKIQDAICGLNYNSKTNWILDLRLNNGGNFPAMIAGIGNIVGDGHIGYATGDHEKPDKKLFLKNGNYFQNDILQAGSSMTCAIPNYKPKIAVIIGSGTNSAAEDICIALKGRPSTRFFGEKTKGSVTGNSTLFIDEITTFVLGTSYYKDRTGKVYQEGIDPDVIIEDEDDFYNLKNDRKITAALEWLKTAQ